MLHDVTRFMPPPAAAGRVLGVLLMSALSSGCAIGTAPPPSAPERSARCHLRVILGVLPGTTGPEDIELPPQAQAAGERLTYLRTITAQHVLYELSAPGGAEACQAALARLARDPRLRSAEPDGQRKAQESSESESASP